MEPSFSFQTDKHTFITQMMDELHPKMIQWRRDFHHYPESAWTEYRTSARIAELLESWGWKIYIGKEAIEPSARMGVPSLETLEQCEERALQEGVSPKWMNQMSGGNTGVIAEWDTGVKGPVFAFRFDIDCNDVQETKKRTHFPIQKGFSSLHDGCMHACGHDGHTSMGLGLAKLISQYHLVLPLKGKIRLLFQPAEEGCRGALAMVEKGWLDDIDYFLSGHIGFRSFELGEIVLNTTGFYATTKLDATLIGRAAHAGGEPELGRNALLAASTAVLNLHAVSRHSQGASRINVGNLTSGSARNIIPSLAYLQLETRGETQAINHYLYEEAKRILQASAQMYQVELILDIVGKAGQATGSPDWVDQLDSIFSNLSGIHKVIHSLPLGASEDVVHMMQRVQEHGGLATYLLFGSPLAAMHHQPDFNFNEDVLRNGVEGYIRAILEKQSID